MYSWRDKQRSYDWREYSKRNIQLRKFQETQKKLVNLLLGVMWLQTQLNTWVYSQSWKTCSLAGSISIEATSNRFAYPRAKIWYRFSRIDQRNSEKVRRYLRSEYRSLISRAPPVSYKSDGTIQNHEATKEPNVPALLGIVVSKPRLFSQTRRELGSKRLFFSANNQYC